MLAFTCTIVPPADGVFPMTFKRWIARPRSVFGAGDELFILRISGQDVRFRANMPGLLAEQRAVSGNKLEPETPIAIAWVEGEDIPYGRPYISRVNDQV